MSPLVVTDPTGLEPAVASFPSPCPPMSHAASDCLWPEDSHHGTGKSQLLNLSRLTITDLLEDVLRAVEPRLGKMRLHSVTPLYVQCQGAHSPLKPYRGTPRPKTSIPKPSGVSHRKKGKKNGHMSQKPSQRFEMFYCQTSFNVWKHDCAAIVQMRTLEAQTGYVSCLNRVDMR